MKKILLLALVGIFLLAIGTSRAYTIKANSVFINDSNVYISAEPHTLYSSGYVTFTVTPKSYTGDVNVIWGFNTSQTIPTSAELYHPHNVSWNTTSSYSVTNVNGFWETTKPCDYGNEYNTYKREVNYTLSGNNTTTTEQKVFCFDSWTQDGSDYTVYWHTEHTKQVNWVDVSQHINSIEHDFDGKNKWYYATNLPVVAGHTYILRSYIKIPISLEGSSGKYDFAIYPSSYGTNIGQAISNGHFYYLDPWWNASYSYRRNITSTTSSYDIGMAINGTNGFGGKIIWYNPSQIGGTPALYYENASVYAVANDTTESNYETEGGGENNSISSIWGSDIVGVWHLSDSLDSTFQHNITTISGAIPSTGKFGSCYNFDGADDYIYVDTYSNLGVDGAGNKTLTAWINPDSYPSGDSIIIDGYQPAVSYRLHWAYISDADGDTDYDDISFWYKDCGGTVSDRTLVNSYNTSQWYFIAIVFDDTNLRAYGYLNGVQKFNVTMPSTNLLSSRYLCLGKRQYYSDEFFDGKVDELRMYSKALTESEIQAIYNNSQHLNNLLGSEEENSKTISGTVKDASGNAISGARVYILYQNNNSLLANLTTNSTGGFEYSTPLTGNFSICAYNPTNVSQGGSCKPFVEVT